jgi:hypothetical protein
VADPTISTHLAHRRHPEIHCRSPRDRHDERANLRLGAEDAQPIPVLALDIANYFQDSLEQNTSARELPVLSHSSLQRVLVAGLQIKRDALEKLDCRAGEMAPLVAGADQQK